MGGGVERAAPCCHTLRLSSTTSPTGSSTLRALRRAQALQKLLLGGKGTVSSLPDGARQQRPRGTSMEGTSLPWTAKPQVVSSPKTTTTKSRLLGAGFRVQGNPQVRPSPEPTARRKPPRRPCLHLLDLCVQPSKAEGVLLHLPRSTRGVRKDAQTKESNGGSGTPEESAETHK